MLCAYTQSWILKTGENPARCVGENAAGLVYIKGTEVALSIVCSDNAKLR